MLASMNFKISVTCSRLWKVPAVALFYFIILGFFFVIPSTSRFVQETTCRPRSTSVFSLSTRGLDGRSTMNIITYASPVSISPTLWGISLFKGTQSHANMMSDKVGVLALLPENFNLDAVMLMGKESGKNIDKEVRLKNIGVPVEKLEVENVGVFSVLSEANQLIVLKVDESKPIVDVGDHDFFMCSPHAYFASTSQHSHGDLTTQYLRDQGVI